MAIKKEVNAANEIENQPIPCHIYLSYDHHVERCASLPAMKATLDGQANFFYQYKVPPFRDNNNNGYENTYHPNWKNRPNLSWRQNQGLNYNSQAPTHGNSLTNDMSYLKRLMFDLVGEHKMINKRHDQMLETLEKAQGDRSQKMDNMQQTLSKLNNALTIQERGKFLSQPLQNPRGMHEVDINEGNYKEVKVVMTLKNGRQIQPSFPISREEVVENKGQGISREDETCVLEGYNDANWISNVKDSKSQSGYVFTLGGATVSWKFSKQMVIVISTIESKFIALDKCGEEVEWLRHFLEDIPRWIKPVPPICIHCDSQYAIGRVQNNMYNSKSRHICRKHNIIRQLLSTEIISLDYVKSKDSIMDQSTKGLNRELVKKSSRGMRLKPIKK